MHPIFRGGLGGLVGPARIAYGSVVAAGGICRQDITEENRLHIPAAPAAGTTPYETGVYGDVNRIIRNNLYYIGSIIALKEWYRNVRRTFMCRDRFDRACLSGALKNLDLMLDERIRRLGDLARNMKQSIRRLEAQGDAPERVLAGQHRLHNRWESIEFELKQADWTKDAGTRETFLSVADNLPVGGTYVETIRALEPGTREAGRTWLRSIVEGVAQLWSAGTE
jgi:UDP-N-acetylglucosamine/UDP-N-acetylgalactosamine diphosphorylase